MYPTDSLQSFIGDKSWWIKTESKRMERGRLLKAFLPHVDQNPKKITALARKKALLWAVGFFQISAVKINERVIPPKVPVATLPLIHGEINAVYRAKKRPALVICTGGPNIPRELTYAQPKNQTGNTVLVAPYYGADKDGTRAGYNPEFVTRIRHCEFPNYMWDMLPIPGGSKESILRLNQIQPLGNSHLSFELTDYRLSDQAVIVMDEWIEWLLTENFCDESDLLDIRQELLTN